MRNPVTGISLGYGFLIMSSTESAFLAMQYLHGVQLRGRPLRVKWAGRNIKNDANSQSLPRFPRDSTAETVINSVHVRFQALHVSASNGILQLIASTDSSLLHHHSLPYISRSHLASSRKSLCISSFYHLVKLSTQASRNPMSTKSLDCSMATVSCILTRPLTELNLPFARLWSFPETPSSAYTAKEVEIL